MAGVTNTLVKVLDAKKNRVLYWTGTLTDSTNPTAYAIYDSSTWSGTDSLTSTIVSIKGHIAGSPATARAKLIWDATTAVDALSLPVGVNFDLRFKYMGGLKNQAGSTGRTGDIQLTTTGMASGDTATIVMEIKND